ncbi:MAG: hypothetical protein IT463_02655, partial [Planctomycetes bacterium]|nr:hypothetical protein [Planctomycetota bacterium]
MAASAHLRLPPAARPRTALLAALLALALLAGWELVLGASSLAGVPFETSVSLLRERVLAHEEDQAARVAFLGSSRTFCGISPEEFLLSSGHAVPVDMLAAPGTSSVRLLRLMSDRGRLHGVAVVEVLPDIFYRDHPAPLALKAQAELESAQWYVDMDQTLHQCSAKLHVFSPRASPLGRSRRILRRMSGLEDPQEEAAHLRAHISHQSGWTEIVPNPGYLRHARHEILQVAAGAYAHK